MKGWTRAAQGLAAALSVAALAVLLPLHVADEHGQSPSPDHERSGHAISEHEVLENVRSPGPPVDAGLLLPLEWAPLAGSGAEAPEVFERAVDRPACPSPRTAALPRAPPRRLS